MSEEINSLRIHKGTSLLPIGSVVLTGFIEQAVMIYGRKQQQVSSQEEKVWDYVACPYPQGHLSNETNVFFNHDQIEHVLFKGLETDGELALRTELTKIF
ncbi:DUF4176 domain-containing protein [Halobacillus fulvus]|nr:DUF4176 domain-containing protein [Halobacillus fulvus]